MTLSLQRHRQISERKHRKNKRLEKAFKQGEKSIIVSAVAGIGFGCAFAAAAIAPTLVIMHFGDVMNDRDLFFESIEEVTDLEDQTEMLSRETEPTLEEEVREPDSKNSDQSIESPSASGIEKEISATEQHTVIEKNTDEPIIQPSELSKSSSATTDSALPAIQEDTPSTIPRQKDELDLVANQNAALNNAHEPPSTASRKGVNELCQENTELSDALKSQSLDIQKISALLAAGANPNFAGKEGKKKRTPFSMAIGEKNVEAVKLMLDYCPLDLTMPANQEKVVNCMVDLKVLQCLIEHENGIDPNVASGVIMKIGLIDFDNNPAKQALVKLVVQHEKFNPELPVNKNLLESAKRMNPVLVKQLLDDEQSTPQLKEALPEVINTSSITQSSFARLISACNLAGVQKGLGNFFGKKKI